MKQALIITGSARPNSVNSTVVKLTADRTKAADAEVVIADLAELALPFYDAPVPASADDYTPPHESVATFSKMVADADAVVIVGPEYNHSLSGIQKNALDWVYKEWNGKPVGFVGYGWYAAANSHDHLVRMNEVLKMKLGEKFTGLGFMKDIGVDGTLLDEAGVTAMLDATIAEILS